MIRFVVHCQTVNGEKLQLSRCLEYTGACDANERGEEPGLDCYTFEDVTFCNSEDEDLYVVATEYVLCEDPPIGIRGKPESSFPMFMKVGDTITFKRPNFHMTALAPIKWYFGQ